MQMIMVMPIRHFSFMSDASKPFARNSNLSKNKESLKNHLQNNTHNLIAFFAIKSGKSQQILTANAV